MLICFMFEKQWKKHLVMEFKVLPSLDRKLKRLLYACVKRKLECHRFIQTDQIRADAVYVLPVSEGKKLKSLDVYFASKDLQEK